MPISRYRDGASRPFLLLTPSAIHSVINKVTAALVLLTLCWQAQAANTKVYTEFDSFTRSDPVTINGAFHEWEGKFYGGDQQYSYNWAEIGVREKHWGLGFLKRLDYQVKYSDKMAETLYLTQNKLDLTTNQDVPLYLDVHHFQGTGVRLSYRNQTSAKFNFEVGLSYLKGERLTEGNARGNLTPLSQKDYDYTADVDYFYSEDDLFDRIVSEPQGKGFSFDLKFDYNISERSKLTAKIQDAWAEIYWKNAPFTRATAHSDTKQFDADGYVHIESHLAGIEGQRNYRQTLPARTKLSLSHKIGLSTEAEINYWRLPLDDGYNLGIGRSWKKNKLSIHYWPELGAVGLGLELGRLSIAITSDKLDFDDARTLGVNITF